MRTWIQREQTSSSRQIEPGVAPAFTRLGVAAAQHDAPGHLLPTVRAALSSHGQPLDSETRSFMESRFGHDFSRVRVHADSQASSSAKSMGAAAYTVGESIIFRADQYAPATPPGRRLLAHELAHVVQQGGGVELSQRRLDTRSGLDESAEREADAAADNVTWGQRVIIARRAESRGGLIQMFRYRPAPNQGRYVIDSSVGPAARLGQVAAYRLTVANPQAQNISGNFRITWVVSNNGIERARFIQSVSVLSNSIVGPHVGLGNAGRNLIRAIITQDERPFETVEFEQSVTASGRSLLHEEIGGLAQQTTADPGVREWTTREFASWQDLRIIGGARPAAAYIHEFKRQWVRAYRRVIRAAAQRFNLPPLLLAGVAYNEVGGDPQWIDSVARAVRRNLPLTNNPQLTSFGNVSTQLRRGAETLGYSPSTLNDRQEEMIVSSLEDARQNIFIAASHLADLRDIDFPGTGAAAMTFNEMRVTATRFNRGPNLSLQAIQTDMSYGQRILDRVSVLYSAISD